MLPNKEEQPSYLVILKNLPKFVFNLYYLHMKASKKKETTNKRLAMKNSLGLLVFTVLLSSCSSVSTITLSVVNPAPVGIPASVKKVGVIDCSQSKPSNNKIISFDAKGLKKEGVAAELNGLQSELTRAKRFDSVKQIMDPTKYSTEDATDISQLGWDKMEQVCNQNNVDILFVLETYEIDTRVNISTSIGFGRGINYVETGGDMNTSLLSGWRIYDPLAKIVVDEYSFTQNFNFGASDINPFSTVVGVISSNSAVKNMSGKAGRFYARRVIPTNEEVERDYYVRGSDKLKEAKHFVQKNDWVSASDIWQKETNNLDPKIAGRACFNLAVANEVYKKYDLAIDWAIQAYKKLNNYKADEYINILKDRRQKYNILKELESK
jgi:hypothetical protein